MAPLVNFHRRPSKKRQKCHLQISLSLYALQGYTLHYFLQLRLFVKRWIVFSKTFPYTEATENWYLRSASNEQMSEVIDETSHLIFDCWGLGHIEKSFLLTSVNPPGSFKPESPLDSASLSVCTSGIDWVATLCNYLMLRVSQFWHCKVHYHGFTFLPKSFGRRWRQLVDKHQNFSLRQLI